MKRNLFFTKKRYLTVKPKRNNNIVNLTKDYYFTLLVSLSFLLISLTTQAQDVLVGLTSNGGAEGRGTAFSFNTSSSNFSIIKGFADWGKSPGGDLVLGNDGNFYGMTSTGGTYNFTGTIFKLTPGGTVSILKQLNGTSDGSYPYGELRKGSDGSLYGMTSSGGSAGYGTIFKITTAGVFTLLKTFNYTTDGSGPRGHLILAKDGNFYGITRSGGASGYGTIFRMTPAGVFTTLHSLNNTTEGGGSYGSLTEGTDGILYGITYSGGTYSYGTIFKITTAGVFTVLHQMNSATDGGNSESDLVQGTDGNFYGMCYRGGTNSNGTIFKITSSGAFTVLRHLSFSKDGGYPYGNLYQYSDGNLYGMCTSGGVNSFGTIFKMTTSGMYTVLHSFVPATEGSTPNAGLVKGSDGNLYGLTSADGSLKGGTAFKITTSGTLTVLASFNGASIGNAPFETLLKAKDSAYYGTTSGGGKYGYGTIFKLCGGSTSVLYSFNQNTDGGIPKGSLIQATDGNLYGTTSVGGTNGSGTIFKITTGGTFTVLRHLNATADGSSPQGSLVQASDGFLYGMTNSGGTNSVGTIFKISTTGTYTVLHHLLYTTDGSNPEGNLVVGTDGNLYGMTYSGSHIFKITTAGVFTSLHTFTTAEGNYPLGSLLLAEDGYFYGTTSSSGANGYGTIFKMSSTGTVTVLKNLNGTADGKTPKGNLLQAKDGNFYGMTSAGGTYNFGTLFKITATGTYTVLRNFNMTTDGGNPFGSLIIAPTNNLIANAQNVTTTEDISKAITLTGSGGSALNYNISSKPLHGSISGTGANITYKPSANYNGKDSFYFTVNVGCLASAPAKINITIAAVNDTPVLASIGNKNIVLGNTLTFTAAATDVDAGQALTYSLVSAPAGASVNSSTGAFSWKPTATGTYTFKVRVTDNGTPALYDEEQIIVLVAAAKSTTPGQSAKKIWKFLKAKLFPNPVLEKLIVRWESFTDQVAITICDIKGAIVYSSAGTMVKDNELEISAVTLKPGIYFLHLQSGESNQTIRFIKL